MSFITLMYHEIREDYFLDSLKPSKIVVGDGYQDLLPPPLFVGLEQFRTQMEYLSNEGYHTLTLYEVKDFLLKGQKIPEKSVLITFDDCYQSVLEYAYPILKTYGLKASAFVVGGWLNKESHIFQANLSVCLTSTDLMLMKDVFEYANHSYHLHTRENQQLTALITSKEDIIIQDIQTCSTLEILDHPDVFAYPFGIYQPDTLEILKKSGISLAFTTNPGFNDQDTNLLELHRTLIPTNMNLHDFKDLLQNKNKELL